MSISITIDIPKSNYFGGERVEGNLVVKASGPVKIPGIVVNAGSCTSLSQGAMGEESNHTNTARVAEPYKQQLRVAMPKNGEKNITLAAGSTTNYPFALILPPDLFPSYYCASHRYSDGTSFVASLVYQLSGDVAQQCGVTVNSTPTQIQIVPVALPYGPQPRKGYLIHVYDGLDDEESGVNKAASVAGTTTAARSVQPVAPPPPHVNNGNQENDPFGEDNADAHNDDDNNNNNNNSDQESEGESELGSEERRNRERENEERENAAEEAAAPAEQPQEEAAHQEEKKDEEEEPKPEKKKKAKFGCFGGSKEKKEKEDKISKYEATDIDGKARKTKKGGVSAGHVKVALTMQTAYICLPPNGENVRPDKSAAGANTLWVEVKLTNQMRTTELPFQMRLSLKLITTYKPTDGGEPEKNVFTLASRTAKAVLPGSTDGQVVMLKPGESTPMRLSLTIPQQLALSPCDALPMVPQDGSRESRRPVTSPVPPTVETATFDARTILEVNVMTLEGKTKNSEHVIVLEDPVEIVGVPSYE